MGLDLKNAIQGDFTCTSLEDIKQVDFITIKEFYNIQYVYILLAIFSLIGKVIDNNK